MQQQPNGAPSAPELTTCGSLSQRFIASAALVRRCGRGAIAMASAHNRPEFGQSCRTQHKPEGSTYHSKITTHHNCKHLHTSCSLTLVWHGKKKSMGSAAGTMAIYELACVMNRAPFLEPGFFLRFGTLATVGYKTPKVLFFWLHIWRQCPPALLFWLQRPKCCQTLILMCYDYWGSRGSQEGSNGPPSRAPGYNRLLSSLGLAGFEPTTSHSNSTPSTPKGTCPQVTITNRHWEKITGMPRKTATRQFFAAGLLATQGSPVFKFG